jgi:hypothetical protein
MALVGERETSLAKAIDLDSVIRYLYPCLVLGHIEGLSSFKAFL